MDWSEKVVLVTGAAGGMGLAFARRFAAAGAALALADLDAKRVSAAAGALGSRTLPVVADVARVADCAAMVAATIARFGRLDLLVNSAGIWVEGPAEEMGEAEWDRCLDINLKGTFFACRHAIPELRKTGGAIINMASDAGLMGSAGASVYCASKGGVVQLTRALALELAPQGVRCNAVCPGLIDTPMGRDATRRRPDRALAVPFGRQGTGWEVAYACLFLISNESSYVNAHALLVDGGLGVGVMRAGG